MMNPSSPDSPTGSSNNHSHHNYRHHRRRRKKISSINQYFTSHILYNDHDDGYRSKNNSGSNHVYRMYNMNQFLPRVFLSFALVWTFFTFLSVTQDVPDITNNDKNSNIILHRNDNNNNNDLNIKGKKRRKDRTRKRSNDNYDNVNNNDIINIKKNNHEMKQHQREKNQLEDNIIYNSQFHPEQQFQSKAAFILVATKYLTDPIKSMSNAIESIIRNTDQQRILCILPIFSHSLLLEYGLNPMEVREYFEIELEKMFMDPDFAYDANDNSDSGDAPAGGNVRGSRRRNRNKRGNKRNEEVDKESHVQKIKLIIEEEDDNKPSTTYTNNNITSTSASKRRIGVAKSRRNAAQYIQSLHEKERLKQSAQNIKKNYKEEIILTFLRPDSEIHKHDWLEIVSHALLGPIPTYNPTKDSQSFHRRNAVSFALSQRTRLQQHMTDRKNKHHPHYHHHYTQHYLHDHKQHNTKNKRYTTTSLDINLTPIHSTTPLQADIELTNGRSYPTPILEGSATSLLLSTFMELNSNVNVEDSNRYLISTVAADVELSLSLWLCGSGIDIINELHVEKNVLLMQKERDYVRNEEKVWLINEWINNNNDGNNEHNNIGQKLLQRFNSTDISRNMMHEMSLKKNLDGSSSQLRKKCRSFDWYMKEVNIYMQNQLNLLDQYQSNENLDTKNT